MKEKRKKPYPDAMSDRPSALPSRPQHIILPTIDVSFKTDNRYSSISPIRLHL